jgi:Zn-dependent protease with chaperone function
VTKLKCTAEQADAVQLYLWLLRDALNLSHWDVYLSSKAADTDCHASVLPTEGRWTAEVRINQHFWTRLDDTEKRSVLTHELLHLVHRGMSEVVRKSLHVSGYLPQGAYRLLWEQVRLESELLVDHLTTVIAPTMPAWSDDR